MFRQRFLASELENNAQYMTREPPSQLERKVQGAELLIVGQCHRTQVLGGEHGAAMIGRRINARKSLDRHVERVLVDVAACLVHRVVPPHDASSILGACALADRDARAGLESTSPQTRLVHHVEPRKHTLVVKVSGTRFDDGVARRSPCWAKV